MKKVIFLLIFVFSLSSSSFSQADKDKIEAAISKFFDGISALDDNLMKANSTSDFILLENGNVMSLDTLISKISARKNSGIIRVNSFQFISTERKGDIAWVSYHNTADFSMKEKKQTIKWLESAVLIKEKGTWKIKLLHSTKKEVAK